MDNRLYVTFTLDVDPDCNKAVRGRIDSLSYPPEKGLVKVDAARRGLIETLQILKHMDIPASLFFEARTAQLLAENGLDLQALTAAHEIGCHSHRHEDFLGSTSGMPISRTQAREIISRSMEILNGIFHNRKITGFRAPYLKINRELLSLLGTMGFEYDSSIINDCIRPFYMKSASLWEFTVASLRADSGRRITSYLHPVFDGKREVSEYVWAVGSQARRIRGGLFILAFHPWELFITYQGRALSEEDTRKRLEKLYDILQGLKKTRDIKFVTLDRYLEIHGGRQLEQPQVT